MAFRTHLGRPLDFRNPWNLAAAILTVAGGAGGLALVAGDGEDAWLPIQAAGTVFLVWALAREIDPDHQASALLVAVAGGAWAMLGQPTALLPLLALMVATRVVTETTGRRPLSGDLVAVAALAAGVSFTPVGWVTGFGLAVAIYLDQRLSGAPTRAGIYAAIGAAVGSSLVATLTGTFPRSLPEVLPLLATGLGLLALVTILREPAAPLSFVDSKDRRFIRRDRLHVSRILAGLVIFTATLVAGESALVVGPMALTLVVTLIASEIDRIVRADRPA